MRIGAKIRTFSVKNVLHVVGFPNAIPNMLWGQRLILALMGRHAHRNRQSRSGGAVPLNRSGRPRPAAGNSVRGASPTKYCETVPT